MDGYNGYNGNNGNNGFNGYNRFEEEGYASNYERWQAAKRQPAKCPGKEVTTLVFGINALFWAALGLLFCWFPICCFIYVIGAGCMSGVSLVFHNKVMMEAEVTTKKVHVGKKLAVAALIVSGVALLLTIIFMAGCGMSVFNGASTYSPSPTYTYYSF